MHVQWIRKGEVSSVDAESMTVRVVFDGLDTSVSNDLTVLVSPGRAQRYMLPDIGDRVVCVFTENEDGYCIGLEQTMVPEENEGAWGIWFDDDNQIVFEDGKLSIKVSELAVEGKLSIQSDEVLIDGKLTINAAEVQINGNLSVSGTINGLTPGSGDL